MGTKNKQVSTADSSPIAQSVSSQYWPYVALLLIVVFFSLIRVRLLDLPLERDEGEYAYAGQLLLQGIPPYQLAYNMKLPGTYIAYAMILAVFGQTPVAVHAGLLLVNAATIVLVFFLAMRLFGSLAAVVSAASYALLSTNPSVLGFAAHATHFVALPAVAGLLLLLKAIETGSLWRYFWSGILVGLAFVMKQPGIFFILFAGLYFLHSQWKRSTDWRAIAARGGMLGLGSALPFFVVCLVLWKWGVFPKFWFWTFVYARQYGFALGPLEGSQVLWMMAPLAIGAGVFIWALAAVGLSAIFWNDQARSHCVFLAGFLLFSFLAVCPGFYFRSHYFVVMLPAIALLAGVAVAAATREFQKHAVPPSLRFVPLLLFGLAFIYPLVEQHDFLFAMQPLVACQSLYAPNPFPEARAIGDYIKSHTSPDARIAVLGSEPEIFFYAQRHSATGYIYVYPLMENQKYASTMQQQMIADIEHSRPQWIVFVNVPFSWVVRPDSDTEILAWSQKFLDQHYELNGVVDILEQSKYLWGPDAKLYRPTSRFSVEIFKLRTP